MIAEKISGFSQKRFKKLFDKVGALEKSVKMRRLEPYADIIGAEMEKYNQDDGSRTMMFKLLRNPVEGTTTRRKHTENVAEIAGKIADEFDWLSSDLTRVMAKQHDTGHTFLGHSGEWWLSGIKDTYAMGNYVHNALGARKLVYRNDIFSDVEKAIKEKEPNISPRKLAAIKRDLWLIVDGINSHNGEKSEYSYAPDFSKSEKRFYDEIMGCFVKKGFDRSLEPATAEGSLMRLCDKISYIPFDLVDSFRNGCNIESATLDGKYHNFYQEYREKFKALGMGDDALERLLACKTEEEYDAFAHEMQEILVADVIRNTKRNNIRMSPETSKIMHGIRDINNSMMVNYTVMKEDHKVYPAAMEELMKRYARIIKNYGLLDKSNIENSSITRFEDNPEMREQFIEACSSVPYAEKFAEFLANTSKKDFAFTVEMIRRSFDEIIDSELEAAKSIASGRVQGVTIEAKGNKKERMNTYVEAFKDKLETAYDLNYLNAVPMSGMDEFKRKVWLDKTKKKLKAEILSGNPMNPVTAGTTDLEDRIAMELGAEFLASLNDEEWKQLLLDARIVSETEMDSLTRPYSTFAFRKESQKHKDWDNIAKLQAKSTENTSLESPKEGFFERAKRFLGIERDR